MTLGPSAAPGLENIPTADELGLKGLDCGAWGAFSFPKGTPKAIVDRLAKASSDAIDTPAVVERYKGIGVVVAAKDRRTPEYFTKFVQSEIERWAVPIKASGMQDPVNARTLQTMESHDETGRSHAARRPLRRAVASPLARRRAGVADAHRSR